MQARARFSSFRPPEKKLDFGVHFGDHFGVFWKLQSLKTSSWGTPESVSILGSIWGGFSNPKLDSKIDEKSLLGAMLVQDDPKDYFGSICPWMLEMLGSILKHFMIDVGAFWDRFWTNLG